MDEGRMSLYVDLADSSRGWLTTTTKDEGRRTKDEEQQAIRNPKSKIQNPKFYDGFRKYII
jgi:hypothetical protein